VTYKYKHINLRERFLSFIKEHQLIQSNEIVLLAVSGGVDSVVMSYLFHQLQLNFAIAHCNFSLRGADSDADQAFVQRLAQDYRVNFYTKRFDTQAYAQEHQLSIQMAARALRYQWFKELCQTHHLDKLATAHHANDSIETLFFNLIKGTGIAGLHGILPKQESLIRPLLFANKEDIIQYAQAYQLKWREDLSNMKDDYARNLIRNRVIPPLKRINPNLETTITTTIERTTQIESFFNEQLAQLKQEIFHQEGTVYYLAIEKIKDKPWAPVVVWEWLKSFGFNFSQIKNLLQASIQSGKIISSNTHQIYVDRARWILTDHKQAVTSNISMITRDTTNIILPAHQMQIKIMTKNKYQIIHDKQIAAIDLDKLKFPLLIRPWQAGDFFYPLGMQKKKKLSDFLIDLKVPVLLKQGIYVLVSGGNIVWVIGYRLDDRFKISECTEQVYEITLLPSNVLSSYDFK